MHMFNIKNLFFSNLNFIWFFNCLQCEDTSKIKKYLELPSLKDDFSDPKNGYKAIPYPHSNKEFIVVETFLCSSKFAQKGKNWA